MRQQKQKRQQKRKEVPGAMGLAGLIRTAVLVGIGAIWLLG